MWYRQAVSVFMAFIIQKAYEDTSEISLHHQTKGIDNLPNNSANEP